MHKNILLIDNPLYSVIVLLYPCIIYPTAHYTVLIHDMKLKKKIMFIHNFDMEHKMQLFIAHCSAYIIVFKKIQLILSDMHPFPFITNHRRKQLIMESKWIYHIYYIFRGEELVSLLQRIKTLNTYIYIYK